MRRACRIELSEEERATLEQWSRGRRTAARVVQRAKIVLRAAAGMQNKAIAARWKSELYPGKSGVALPPPNHHPRRRDRDTRNRRQQPRRAHRQARKTQRVVRVSAHLHLGPVDHAVIVRVGVVRGRARVRRAHKGPRIRLERIADQITGPYPRPVLTRRRPGPPPSPGWPYPRRGRNPPCHRSAQWCRRCPNRPPRWNGPTRRTPPHLAV